MADHGEKATLAPGWDSCREREDSESAVCDSMGQSFFVALCICRGTTNCVAWYYYY